MVSVPSAAVYDSVVEELKSSGASTRCSRLKQLLESLQFQVQRVKSGNHYVIRHRGIPGFLGSNYNCGHGTDPQVNPVYIHKLRRLIEANKEHLVKNSATP